MLEDGGSDRHVGGMTPHITIRDGRAADAIAFYEKAFGAQGCRAQRGRMAGTRAGGGGGGALSLGDQFWGDRYGQLSDPFGYIWSIGSLATKH